MYITCDATAKQTALPVARVVRRSRRVSIASCAEDLTSHNVERAGRYSRGATVCTRRIGCDRVSSSVPVSFVRPRDFLPEKDLYDKNTAACTLTRSIVTYCLCTRSHDYVYVHIRVCTDTEHCVR